MSGMKRPIYTERYLTTAGGELLRLDPYTGVVADAAGHRFNGRKVDFYREGELADKDIPEARYLARRLLRFGGFPRG